MSATASGVDEVHILWISEGMSCDGDSVSVTAASLPSIEEVLLGAVPGLPKVHLHNKVLDPSLGGEEFLKPFREAADGILDAPFVLVIEGSIPNEKINGDGYWTSFGNDLATGEPLTLNWWLDRLPQKAWVVVLEPDDDRTEAALAPRGSQDRLDAALSGLIRSRRCAHYDPILLSCALAFDWMLAGSGA